MNETIKFITGSIRRLVLICMMTGAIAMLALFVLISIISAIIH